MSLGREEGPQGSLQASLWDYVQEHCLPRARGHRHRLSGCPWRRARRLRQGEVPAELLKATMQPSCGKQQGLCGPRTLLCSLVARGRGGRSASPWKASR